MPDLSPPSKATGNLHPPHAWIVTGLVLLSMMAGGLRLWGVEAKGLTFDEIDSVNLSSLSPGEILRFHSTLVFNAPGYFLLQHVLLPLGKDEFWLRLPSILLGTVCVPAMYALGAAIFGPSEGVLAAALVAFSPLLATLSQQARMYALFHLLAILSCLWFFRTCLTRRWRDASLFVLSSVLALHVHYLMLFLIAADAALFLVLLVKGPIGLPAARTLDARRALPLVAASLGAVAVLLVPWVVMAGTLWHSPVVFPSYGGENYLQTLVSTLSTFAAGSAGDEVLSVSWPLAGPRLVFMTLFLSSLVLAAGRKDSRLRLVLLWFFLVLGGTIAWLGRIGSYFEPRLASFAQPLWALALARAIALLGFDLFPSRPLRRLAAGTLVCALASAPSLTAALTAAYFGPARWRDAAEIVKERLGPEEGIILLDIAGPSVSFYLERWGLGERARPVSSFEQVREECSRHPSSWFVLIDWPLFPPLVGAKQWLLETADYQKTLGVGVAQRLVVGHLGTRCAPSSKSPRDPSYWMDLDAVCPPARRFQMLYFLALPRNGSISVESLVSMERKLGGRWTEEKLRRFVQMLAESE